MTERVERRFVRRKPKAPPWKRKLTISEKAATRKANSAFAEKNRDVGSATALDDGLPF